jgi:hypothetical protein
MSYKLPHIQDYEEQRTKDLLDKRMRFGHATELIHRQRCKITIQFKDEHYSKTYHIQSSYVGIKNLLSGDYQTAVPLLISS